MWYVLKRPLVRPKTSYMKAAFCVVFYIIANLGMITLLHEIFCRLGIFYFWPKPIEDFIVEHNSLTVFILTLFSFSLSAFFVRKKALIGMIHLYQRYAPEDVRRRCLLKPTCSEYAIMVIEKYGVIIGLRKIYIRLFRTCRGRIYRYDFPY